MPRTADTKHVLLFPEDPREAFTFAADALDLADRLQTPMSGMLDLDIGMNDWLVEPLAWEDRHYDRGKVMTAEMLEAEVEFGRYLDVDGDKCSTAPIPGRIRRAAPSLPAAPARTVTRAIPRKVPTTSTTCSGYCTNSKPETAGAAPDQGEAREQTRFGRCISARPEQR